MSIEAKIDALIVALEANTAALKGGKPAAAAKGETKAADAPAALTYDKDVKPPFLALVKSHGRDFALGKLKDAFSYENLKEAEKATDKFPEIVAKISEWAKEAKPKKDDSDLA